MLAAPVEPQQPVEGGAAVRLGEAEPLSCRTPAGAVLDIDWSDPVLVSLLVSLPTGPALVELAPGRLIKDPDSRSLPNARQVAVPSTSQSSLPVVYQDTKTLPTLLQVSGRRLGQPPGPAATRGEAVRCTRLIGPRRGSGGLGGGGSGAAGVRVAARAV